LNELPMRTKKTLKTGVNEQVMSRTITNRSGRLVSFRGNSGETWHLAPFASITVMDVEVTNNPKVQKLEANGMITVQQTESVRPEAQRSRTTRARQDKKR
jgi:hypothetical protein